MILHSRAWRIALLLGFVVTFAAPQTRAADTSAGSKNFSVPGSVPNYFSNEAGPLQGPASETRRGPLYTNRAYGASPVAAAVVVVPRTRQHIAMAEPRGRLIRGRPAYNRHARFAEHRTGAHGRVYRTVAHARSRGRVEHVSARSHAIGHRTTRVSSAHRRS